MAEIVTQTSSTISASAAAVIVAQGPTLTLVLDAVARHTITPFAADTTVKVRHVKDREAVGGEGRGGGGEEGKCNVISSG